MADGITELHRPRTLHSHQMNGSGHPEANGHGDHLQLSQKYDIVYIVLLFRGQKIMLI